MGNWIISKSIEIDASHLVEGYKGKCSKLHGHRWKIEVSVIVDKLDDIGIGVDFSTLESALYDLNLDHTHLNEIIVPATAEVLAKYVFDKLKERNIKPYKVTVWETSSNKIEYFE